LIFPFTAHISSRLSKVQYAGEKTESPIVHAHFHAYFDCTVVNYFGRAGGRERLLDSRLSGPEILGFNQFMHKLHFQERADGSERATEQELSDRERQSDTWSCQVRRGKQNRTDHPCAGRLCCLALPLETCRSPEVSDALSFRCPFFPMPFLSDALSHVHRA